MTACDAEAAGPRQAHPGAPGLALLLAAVLGGCGSCDEGHAPEPPQAPASETPPAPAGDAPRGDLVPPGFGLPVPPGAVLRHGQSSGRRGQLLLTTEQSMDDVAAFYEQAFSARGLRVERPPDQQRGSDEHGRPRAVVLGWGEDGSMPAASAVIEHGSSGLTRVELSSLLDGRRAAFNSGPEPAEWRRVTAGFPAAPDGEPSEPCLARMRQACDAVAEAAEGVDAAACADERRGACVVSTDVPPLTESLDAAHDRLIAALRAHDSVGTHGARRETMARARLELLWAKTVAARAMAAGEEHFGDHLLRLLVLTLHVEDEGVVTEDQLPTMVTDWFGGPPPSPRVQMPIGALGRFLRQPPEDEAPEEE